MKGATPESKIIYLVRHGESEGNAKNIFQPPDSPLSEKGKVQAQVIAERVSRLEFEKIITSPLKRALETAGYISKKTGVEYQISELFSEVRKPSVLYNKQQTDKSVESIVKNWEKSLYGWGEKVENGEDFSEIVKRADKALNFLKKSSENSIVVVTHGLFLRVLVLRAVLEESFSGEVLKNFWYGSITENTGLTVLKYGIRKFTAKPRWILVTFNDYAHLGD